MAPRGKTRRDAIVTAARLFDRQGYHGTALTEVLEASGAPKGSFYFHFPGGKEELGLEAVAHSRAQVAALLEGAIARQGSPDRVVRDIGKALERWLVETEFREGCAVSAMTIEAGSISPRMLTACRDAYATWRGLLTADLRAHGHTASEAASLATLIVASLEGAVILSRAERSAAPVRSAGRLLAGMLAAGPPG